MDPKPNYALGILFLVAVVVMIGAVVGLALLNGVA